MSDEPGAEEPSDAGPESGEGPSRATGRTSGPSASSEASSGRSSAGSASADAASGSSASDSASSTGSDAAADGGGTLGGTVSTPPDDEELPLTEHIEEMLGRLFLVVVPAAILAALVIPYTSDIIVRIWYDVHPGEMANCVTNPEAEGCVPPHLYGPFELVLMRLRVAGLAGLLVALPLAIYQTYRFMRPGLYPHERRYYLASVPFSLVLGVVGMLFSYFVILPLLFNYFITYTEGSAETWFALTDTMNLVLIMLGMTALIFQIPLLIMLAIMMGLTSREWLEARRIYFWGLFLGIAFLFGPDPTGMAPILLTATMIVLFEASLLLLRWTGR